MSAPIVREHRPGLPDNASRADRLRHTARHFTEGSTLQMTILVTVLVVLGAALSFASPNFLTTVNIVAIFQTMAVLCIVSIGQTVAILSGGFDLSVGGVVPLAGIVYALVSNAASGPAGVIAGIATALATGAFFGAMNGVFITKLRINAMITTLGTLSVAGGAAYVVGQGQTIVTANPDATVFSEPALGRVSWDVLTLVALVIIGSLMLHYTISGRVVYALGGSRVAARRAGIRVNGATIGVYIVSAGLAAFAGVIATSQLDAASPSAYTNSALSSITAVILGGAALTGGRGTIIGTVVGSLLLGVIGNGLNLLQINTFYQTIITGCVLLIAVGFTRLKDVFARTADDDE